MRAVEFIVRVHDRSYLRRAHRRFERRQVNLAQRALADDHINTPPIILLIISREVLGRSNNSLSLDTTDERNYHLCRQKRIFTGKIFKISAAQWNAVDVHAGSKQYLDAARSAVSSHRCPFFF